MREKIVLDNSSWIRNTSFSNCILVGENNDSVYFEKCVFDDVIFLTEGFFFSRSSVNNSLFKGNKDAVFQSLNNSYFFKCNFEDHRFSRQSSCLSDSSFVECCFSNCKMETMRIYNCDFSDCDFSKATFWPDIFEKSVLLYGGTLKDCKLPEGFTCNSPCPPDFYFPRCPEEGSFIGFKKCEDNKIVKLLIPENAKRVNGTSNVCRCDRAKTLCIEDMGGNVLPDTSAKSLFDPTFVYTVGQEVVVENFDENRWKSASRGIHFYLTREEARRHV